MSSKPDISTETKFTCGALRMDVKKKKKKKTNILYMHLKTGVTMLVSPYPGEPFLSIMYTTVQYFNSARKAILLP